MQIFVTEVDLGKAAAEFPLVECACPTCAGSTLATHEVCHECDGVGYYLREMDSREEHYYIMHLLKTSYQLR